MNLNEKIRSITTAKDGVQTISLTRLMALHDSCEVYTVHSVEPVELNEKKGYLWRLVDSNGECYTTKSCFELDNIAEQVIFAGNDKEIAANLSEIEAGALKIVLSVDTDVYGQTFIRVKNVE